MALSPDGETLAVASGNRDPRSSGLITLWNLTDGSRTVELPQPASCRSVAYSNDGSLLAAGMLYGRLAVWRLDDLSGPLAEATNHNGNIYSIAFSRDNRTLATASKDATVGIWDMETLERLRVLHSHSDRVYAVDFAPAGDRLVTASADQTIRLWSLLRCAFELREVRSQETVSPAFSPNRQRVALPGRSPKSLLRIDEGSPQHIPVFPTTSAAWSTKGQRLAVSSDAVGLFTETSRRVSQLTAERFGRSDLDGDGDLDHYAGFGRPRNMIWQENTGDGRLLPARLRHFEYKTQGMAFDIDSDGDDDWVLPNLAEGRTYVNLHRGEHPPPIPYAVKGLGDLVAVDIADIDLDRRLDILAATGTDGEIFCLKQTSDGSFGDPSAATSVYSGLTNSAAITAIDFDANGYPDIVAGGTNPPQIVCLRNLENGKFELVQKLSTSVSPQVLDAQDIDSDGRPELLVAGTDGIVYFHANGEAFEENPRRLASLENAKWIRPLPANVAILDVESSVVVQAFHAHDDIPNCVATSPDGTRVATVGSDHVIRVWDDGKQLVAIATGNDAVNRLCFTHCGEGLCAAVGDDLLIYDAQSYQLRHRCRAHQGTVTDVSISHDNQIVATVGQDLRVRLWSWETGELVHDLAGHEVGVRSVAFSPDDRLLASGDHSGAVHIWDVATGQELLKLTDFPYRAQALAFTSGRSLTVIGSGRIYLRPSETTPTFVGQWSGD